MYCYSLQIKMGFLKKKLHLDRLWGKSSPLYNGYKGLFIRGKAAGA
jgi:hypothetical protein